MPPAVSQLLLHYFFCAAAAAATSCDKQHLVAHCDILQRPLWRICCILRRIAAFFAAHLRHNSAIAADFEGKMVPVAHFFRAAAAATSPRRQKTPGVCNVLKLLT